ncbi:ABC transporter ATP-binding protein [Streptomyces zhihengii]|uniref:ATP-binding cassette domain-containing protein n=1 Tax=Streptomyces zhihengii TaxID=1818004 RepID=A0ABS2V2X8_9ACTN|nr:ATP-binding cassette domain-containing protein [Streptomyces zhihengii]MBM9623688.1 ATP-binding cassette domain-containing protein [Streptomyces zhihengii]
MIEARELTKEYGGRTAVDALTFTARPGRVTGFLGPNGAGKSTTMRLVLGLDAPTRGSVAVAGTRYGRLAAPLREVGALLDARAVHGGRTVRRHLLGLARSNALPARRVDEVLGTVGLEAVADRRAKGLSLGMAQRLGIAAALLGDPGVLVLDEPVNGLDTEGIRWIRTLLTSLAAEGRTVFLSSHLMSELERTADHLVVIGRGRLLADTSMAEFIDRHSPESVLLRVPDGETARMRAALEALGAVVRPEDRGGLRVTGASAGAVGETARTHGLAVHELTPRRSSLEEIFTAMTREDVEYRGDAPSGPGPDTHTDTGRDAYTHTGPGPDTHAHTGPDGGTGTDPDGGARARTDTRELLT